MAGVACKQQVLASPLVNTSTSDEILNLGNLQRNLVKKLKLKNWFVVRSPQRLYIFNLTKKLNGNLSIRNTISIDDGLIVKVFGENNDNPLFNLRLYRWPQLQNLIEQLSIDVKRESNLDSNKEPIPVAVTTIKEDDHDTNDCQADAAAFEFCATNAVDPHPTFPETLHTYVTVKDEVVPFVRVKSENELMDPVPMSPQSKVVDHPYTCSECDKRFDQNAKLMIHMRTHERKLCPVCNETFTGTMARHMTRKHEPKSSEKSQQCHLCGSEYENAHSLRDHMELNHIGYDEFFCDICNDGKNFKARNVMERHMRRHRRPNRQQPSLEQVSRTEATLNHSGAKQCSQICSTCGKEFSTNRSLSSHMRRHNQNNARPCPICKKSYFELSRHIKTHSKVKKFVCDQCGNRYSRAYTLKEHVETNHAPEGEFFCDICNNGRVYTSKAYLKKHLYKHSRNHQQKTNPQNRQCKLCDKVFSSRYTLISHTSLVHNENGLAYQCKICDKEFRLKTSLAVHEKIHSEKSHICNICSKSFTHANYLRKHLRGHRGANKKPCIMCEKQYVNGFDLRMHMKKIHNVVVKPMTHSSEPVQQVQ